MPIKVQCRGCEKVLNVPDAARGKTVKCPQCEARIKIPAAEGGTPSKQPAGAGARPAARKGVKPKAKDPASSLSGEMFINLNLEKAEDENEQICPYCAAPLEEEDPVCHNCGMNVETGQMDKKEAKKRSRKGPDTNEFWGKAWSDPAKFVREFSTLAFRTGRYWTQFAVMVAACYYMAHDYSVKGPPKTFWYAMTILCVLGIPGWFWTLSMRLIQAEIFREEVKPDRIHFDFLQNVALGLRAVIWPFVVLLPLWMVLGILWGAQIVDAGALKMLAGVAFAAPFVVYPLATIHMTAKYTYKAWIFWDLLVIFGKNFAACFYWLIQAVVVLGPVAGLLAAIHFYGGGINPFSNEYLGRACLNITTRFYALIGETTIKPGDFMFEVARVPLSIIFTILTIGPVATLAGFPALFMMRSNALLAYYFQPSLDLVNRVYPGTAAGFWVRFLAFWGDMAMVPLSSFLVLRIKKAVTGAWLINAMLLLTAIFQGTEVYTFKALVGLFVVYNWWLYFAVSESGTIRSTVAKEAFGMQVNTDKHKQMTLRQAGMRWFCMVFSALTGGLGFVICAFHPQKKALHDLLSKSEVVWKGDK